MQRSPEPVKTETAHQYNISDDRPREVERGHAEEDEQVGERDVVADGDEREVDERRGGQQREPAHERVAVGHARAQPLRQRGAQRHAQRARAHAHQTELVRHAAIPLFIIYYTYTTALAQYISPGLYSLLMLNSNYLTSTKISIYAYGGK